MAERYDDRIMVNQPTDWGELKVRVLKKWIVPDVLKVGTAKSVDMILLDMNGLNIQASIPDVLCPLFDKMIVEGNVYIMSNLTVNYNFPESLTSGNVLVFNVNTDVKLSSCYSIPTHGESMIGSENVHMVDENLKHLIDVIGVITYVRHVKKYFVNRPSSETVTFKLTDDSECRNSYVCELSGKFVDLFRQEMKNITLGLPVVVLQFAKVSKIEGRNIVQSVDGLSKLYVNPNFYEAKKFKKGLVLALNRKRLTLGFSQPDIGVGFTIKNQYQFKSILHLREDPKLGIYIINARLADMTALDTWWYPVCACDIIIESYLGAFFCTKCHASNFVPLLKYRVKMVVEDESGATFVEGFDHVLLAIAVVNPKKPAISRNFFPRAFQTLVGKNMMFIVEKKKHNRNYLEAIFELLCVSDDPELIKNYVEKGLCNTPSKNALNESWNPVAGKARLWEAGESSNAGGCSSNACVGSSNDFGCNSRSVRPRIG